MCYCIADGSSRRDTRVTAVDVRSIESWKRTSQNFTAICPPAPTGITLRRNMSLHMSLRITLKP